MNFFKNRNWMMRGGEKPPTRNSKKPFALLNICSAGQKKNHCCLILGTLELGLA